jgi:hypothetical protein
VSHLGGSVRSALCSKGEGEREREEGRGRKGEEYSYGALTDCQEFMVASMEMFLIG